MSTLFICANCYLKTNDYVRAIQYTSEALQYNKMDTDALICRAKAFENEKQYVWIFYQKKMNHFILMCFLLVFFSAMLIIFVYHLLIIVMLWHNVHAKSE